MQRIRFRQPHMPINSRALVEPAIAKAGVHAHHQKILPAVVEEVADVEAEGRVAVVVAPNEVSVEKHKRAAERAIELDGDAASAVLLGNVERAAVPADARLRISPPQRFVSVRLLFFVVHKRQLYRPVVRQIELAPLRVIKLRRGKPKLARLGKISLAHAKSQVAQRVGAVSLKELPPKVEQQMFPRSHRRHRLRRSRPGIARQQRMSAAHRAGN